VAVAAAVVLEAPWVARLLVPVELVAVVMVGVILPRLEQ